MNISLPQNDDDHEARAKAVEKARAECAYDYQALPPLPLAAKVPDGAGPSVAWTAMVADTMVKLVLNCIKVHKGSGSDDAPDVHDRMTEGGNPMATAFDELKKRIETGGQDARAASLQDFRELFVTVDKPRQPNTFLHDHTFARMRVAGPAPLQIQRIRALDARFPVTEAMFEAALGHRDTLDAAGAEGRLYLADYAVLDGVPGGTYPSAQKYVPAPLALFAVPRGRAHLRPLVPIAIQLGQRPGAGNPIFTPEDGLAWEVAKSLVQTADGNVHQAVHHLGRTHLVLEPFAMATLRRLSTRHPLSALLRHHFEGTLYINDSAVKSLIAPQGGVDAVMAARIEAVHGLVSQTVQAWRFDDSMLPKELASRGVDDPALLPDYPYRDDARLVWDAIHTWIDRYVRLYYTTPADVLADTELQAWAGEIVAADGGRVKGFGQSGRIETIEYLVDAVTHIVFTASAQHAAVNFPQRDIMEYAPAVPLAAYAPPPTSKAAITASTYLDMLPPLGQAHYQLLLGRLLGSIHYTRLGDYPTAWGWNPLTKLGSIFGAEPSGLSDERVQPLLQAFQGSLLDVEQTIVERNVSRPSYEYLLPSQIPQSINI